MWKRSCESETSGPLDVIVPLDAVVRLELRRAGCRDAIVANAMVALLLQLKVFSV